MIDEEKLRQKLAEVLKKTAYRGLHTFEHDHLINDIVQAVNECEVRVPEPELLVGSEEE